MGSIRNNKKYIIPFCIFLLGLIFSWGTWATTGLFSAKAKIMVVEKSIDGINKDLKELNQSQKEMIKEIKDSRDTMYEGQKEMLEILLHIKKKVKENNKKDKRK